MSNEEIFYKAMKQAQENGMVIPNDNIYYHFSRKIGKTTLYNYAQLGAIFDHRFAKAFWAKNKDGSNSHPYYLRAKWQYHLQKMVLEENPIQYLEQFLLNPKGLTV